MTEYVIEEQEAMQFYNQTCGDFFRKIRKQKKISREKVSAQNCPSKAYLLGEEALEILRYRHSHRYVLPLLEKLGIIENNRSETDRLSRKEWI